MAPRSKDGNTAHEIRNKTLRERVTRLVQKDRDVRLAEFVVECSKTAAELEMRWYSNKKDILRSIRSWYDGNSFLYEWALDVIEYTALRIERDRRQGKTQHTHYSEPEPQKAEPDPGSLPLEQEGMRKPLTGHVILRPQTGHVILRPNEPAPKPEPVGLSVIQELEELDTLKQIVNQFVSLNDSARKRVLHYLESL